MENRVGVCEKHHELVHTDAVWREKLAKKKNGVNKKYHALSVLNQIIPHLERELAAFPGHCFVTEGQSTKAFRDANGVEKTHHSDAYCIACSILPAAKIAVPEQMFEIRQYRRHDRQAAHQAIKVNQTIILIRKESASIQASVFCLPTPQVLWWCEQSKSHGKLGSLVPAEKLSAGTNACISPKSRYT